MSYEFPLLPPQEPVKCNRNACQVAVEPLDAWFNIGNGRWYCRRCAGLINELGAGEKPICFRPVYYLTPVEAVRTKFTGSKDHTRTAFKAGEIVTARPHYGSFRDYSQGALLAKNDDGLVDLVWIEEVECAAEQFYPIDVPSEMSERGIDLTTDVGRWRAALYITGKHGPIHPSHEWHDVYWLALNGKSMQRYAINALRTILLAPSTPTPTASRVGMR